MNRSHLLAAIIFLCSSSLISAQSAEFNGLWLGFEPIKLKGDKGAKGDPWFYQNRLSIKNGVVSLEKRPEEHMGKDVGVVSSASDGGFPTFRGRLVVRGRVTVAVLEIESCDYCDNTLPHRPPAKGKEAWHVPNHGVERQGVPKDYPIQLNSHTSLKLDGVTFRRVAKFPPI
jgi:hypothetical protein